MSASRGPSVRQRRLAAELRRLRERGNLTGDDVAFQLKWSTAKVSRIENARTAVKINDVRRLLDLYAVTGPHRDEIIALAHDAAERGWWEEYRDLVGGYPAYIALEAEAGSIRQWESHNMPGLLQTHDYARATILGWNAISATPPREIDRRVEVRLRRQRILMGDRPTDLSVVVDESVLHRRVGDAAVMRAQLRHLLDVSQRDNVHLRILRLDGDHPIMEGSFTLLEFPPVHDVIFPDMVHTESLTVSHFEDEMTTHLYRLAYESLARAALSHEDSRELISATLRIWK
ncbi:helix-turn-helix domain-containing protein [Spirillospora albida]|uniref:helix-turn-helix domain-containing protein n=1 Tax=Spirillospora albida TaxID=58123 RepID=UPI0004C111DE|nr:helix-turn-helix transcriptional regulator [Spirillospora albida]